MAPLYDYQCQEPTCKHQWEEFQKVADREIPTTSPCPKCGKGVVCQLIGAPAVGDPLRLGHIKPTSDFRQRLKDIAKISPGHVMNLR